MPGRSDPPHLTVAPLPGPDLPGFIRDTERRYADQKASFGSVPERDAARQARAETAAAFPDGRLQPGHVVLDARTPDGRHAGHAWWGPHRTELGVAFLYDLVVVSRLRGRGYGRALLAAVEHAVRAAGYRVLALHVFGGNTRAVDLYRTGGYVLTDVMMRRTL